MRQANLNRAYPAARLLLVAAVTSSILASGVPAKGAYPGTIGKIAFQDGVRVT